MTVNIGNALRSPIPASACQTWTSPERQDYQPSDWAGAAPYQIITSLPELELFVRSVYIYFGKWILTARNIGLKRKVKFRPRKVHKTPISDRRVFQSRTYSDFQHLGLSSFVEMDTVHFASDSSKTLLTFFLQGESPLVLMFFKSCLNTYLPTRDWSLVTRNLWKPVLRESSVPVSITVTLCAASSKAV